MGLFFKRKGRLRGGAALCLSALFLFPALTGRAGAQERPAAEPPLISARKLVPVGHTAGIKLFARGVLVVGLTEGNSPAKQAGLAKGDIIARCGGAAVTSSEEFQQLLQEAGGKPLALQVRRDDAIRTLTVTPEKNQQGVWAVGAWIRDSMAGIGTVTFYDPATGVFGALGHGITDTDTAKLMPFSSGSILPSRVKAVKKGEAGSAGELRGDFTLTEELGELCANTEEGVFGTLDNGGAFAQGEAVPVARDDEVTVGPAVVRTNVSGDEVRDYAVKITKILSDSPDGRNMLITVTDPELLAQTGGIVQGMSGSPVLQNGKLVGAVTHVLLNDPTTGYGIFIENMLKAANLAAVEKAG